MEPKVQQVNGITIDYSTSSVEVFPAINDLAGSENLYLKFSKNRIKFLDKGQHAELLVDFDLCLIDRSLNETIMQLFAIFVLSKNNESVTEFTYIEQAVRFGESLIREEITQKQLRDNKGEEILLPVFEVTQDSVHLFD